MSLGMISNIGTGAAMGGAVGGPWGAAIGGGLGLLSGIAGDQAASAAGRMSQAQYQTALALAQQAKQYGQGLETRVTDLARMGPQELQAYEGALSQSQMQLQSDAKLLQSIDPAILEASQQALKLLRGTDAQALDPLRNQRNAQRAELVRSLQEKLGAGAETSSAGMKALNQFDMETSSLLGGAQHDYLNTLLGFTGQSRGQIGQDINTGLNVGQAFGNASHRVAGLALGAGQSTLNAMTGAAGRIYDSAGYAGIPAMYQAQGAQGMAGAAMNVGGIMLGRQMMQPQTPTGIAAMNPTVGWQPQQLQQPTFGVRPVGQ